MKQHYINIRQQHLIWTRCIHRKQPPSPFAVVATDDNSSASAWRMNYPEFNGFCFISFALISNNFPVPSPFFAATYAMNQASYSPSEFESSPNFETVLHAIESKMGRDWDFYRECVEGTVLA